MNWLSILVLIFLAAYIIRGYHNGFIMTIFSICTVFLALVIAYAGTSALSGILQNNDTVYQAVNSRVVKVIDTDAKSVKDQQQYIQTLPVPKQLKDELEENNNKKIYQLMDTSKFEDYVSGYITRAVIKGISFVLLFLVMFIVIRIIAHVLDIVSHLPVLHSINKIGGAVVGAAHGLVVLWILCIVATIYSGTAPGRTVFEAIESSSFLSLIYNNNLLVKYVMDAVQSLL